MHCDHYTIEDCAVRITRSLAPALAAACRLHQARRLCWRHVIARSQRGQAPQAVPRAETASAGTRRPSIAARRAAGRRTAVHLLVTSATTAPARLVHASPGAIPLAGAATPPAGAASPRASQRTAAHLLVPSATTAPARLVLAPPGAIPLAGAATPPAGAAGRSAAIVALLFSAIVKATWASARTSPDFAA
jgi:hypothetical protein